MIQNLPIPTKKLISILILIILLTPNVYCLENIETSQDEGSESSQSDFDSYGEGNENIIDEEETRETISDSDGESADGDSETIPTESVLPEIEVSGGDIEPLGDAKAYLSPALEDETDYFDTSLFTGSFVYSYPIETLRGRAGLEPEVSLTYSSAAGSRGTYGSLGMGWSLNENCIIRDTRYTPENTSDDRFILVLDGSAYKLVYVGADNSYHTEIESFMKIEKSTTNSNSFGDYWILRMPDGTKYRFGYNIDSEQRNSVESRNYVSKWWLDLVEDVNGNQIRYKYLENPKSGEVGSTYLDRITYNDNHSIIDFEFMEKPRAFTGYEYGNKISEKSLISNIIILNDATVLWKYNLEYESKQSKLYLKSITKTGLNSTEFPPTIFEYDSLTGGWQESSSWRSPIDMSGRDKGIRFADVNGDGLEELLQGYRDNLNQIKCSTWINTGNGWELNSSWRTPTYFRDYTYDAGARLADVNGDGLVDIIQHSIDISSAWLNNGTGWEQNNSWAPPLYFGYSSDRGVRIADVNGDGLVDIIQGRRYVGTEQYDAYINTGTGWRQDNSWNPPTYFVDTDLDQGILLADINGDGLVDLIKEGSAWLNNGNGWERDDSWGSPLSLRSLNTGVRLVDINGDGLVDILKSYYNNLGYAYDAWINTGDGWERDNSWNPPTLIASYTSDLGVRFADLNGDGLTDIIEGGYGDCYTWTNTNTASSENYKTPGLLKKIQHPTGGITTIKYKPSSIFDNTGNDGISDLTTSIWVTTKVTKDNGITGTGRVVSTTDYTYKNGMQYFNPPEEIEFRGFGEVTVENEYSISKHFFHQDDVLKGIENHTEVWDKNGKIYSLSDMEYTGQQIHPGVNLVLLDSKYKTQFDGLVQNPTSSAGWSSFIEYDEYDSYGNPLSIIDHGDVNTAGDEKYLHFEYVNKEGPWILGKKTHEWLEDSDQVKKSESWYYYDGTNDNSVISVISKGQLTKTVSWNNMGDNPTILYNYDSYGNIIKITNPKGSSKNITYDNNHVYPVSIENALGQKECYEYNKLGRITKTTDSNGVSTEYIYDDLHRISKIVKPYDDVSSPSIEYTYHQDGVAPETISTKIKEYGSEENSYIINGSIFNNYKTITISPSADGTLTDYQVSFDIFYEPEMQFDFDDLRFVDENDILLPYWIEEKTNSIYAKVWVKVPVIDGIDGTTIKMYYGNSNVPSKSNGNDVFEFFDDFESGVIDTSKWNTIGSPTVIDDGGDKVLRLTPDNHINTFNKFSGTEYAVGGLMKFASFGYYGGPRMSLEVRESNDQAARFSYRIESYPDGIGWTGTSIMYSPYPDNYVPIVQARPSWSTNVWDRFSFSSTNNVQRLTSDKLNLSGTYANNLSGSIFICTWDHGNDIRFSYIYVRKSTSSEPTVTVENNSTFNYKTIIISPSADGTLTDYQVSFDINYEPEMQSDFDDLRFVDENGILLPYWVESKTDSVSARVWVKVPNIDRTSGATVALYYGNSNVSSKSNGNDVFEFFDDFESGVIDTSKWNTIGSPTVIDDGGDKVLRLTPDNHINTFNKFSGTEYAIGGLMKFASFGYYGGPRMSLEVRESNDQAARFSYRIESYPDGIGWTGTSIMYSPYPDNYVPIVQARPSWSTNAWDRFSFSSTNNVQRLTSDKLNLSGTYANNLSGSIFICTWDHGNDIRFSYIYVRKSTSSEPTVTVEDGFVFNNYKTIIISPSADGTLTDYQMSFDINYEPEMQSDFDDLRFVDEDGILLPCWIEEKTDSISAKVWVKVPEIDGIYGTTIKMYYGSSGAPSASNGDAVFDFFDDFSGTSFNTSKWVSIDSDWSVSNGNAVHAINGGIFNQLAASGVADGIAVTKIKIASDGANDELALLIRGTALDNEHTIQFNSRLDNGDFSYTDFDAGSNAVLVTNPVSYDEWHYLKAKFSGSSIKCYYSLDGLTWIQTHDQTTNHTTSNYMGFRGIQATSYVDYVYVRQYASSEPTYTISDLTDKTPLPSDFDSTNSYDGFGQLIQKKYEGEDNWIIQNIIYNELGLVKSVEVPHYLNQSSLSINYKYDTVGRPKIITNTDGTTLTYYYKLDNTTITNQNGVNKTLKSDVFGNVVKVYEYNEGETYVTSYSYDAQNNLIEIIPGFNDPQTPPSVYFTYDSLGRKVAMNDPDMGSWTYEYDLNGNLVNQTDARGVSTRLSYDALDRVTEIDYPNDEDISFTYDLKFNGTLSKVKKGNVSSDYNYDLRYRVKDEAVTIDGTRYTTSYKYDSMDRVIRVTYPNAASVNLRYNNQTLLESVEGVIDNLDYNARNQITRKEYSNGVVTTYTYDSEKLLLDRIYSAGLQDLNYDFDNVGNILEIVDNTQNSVKSYEYDDLDRLVNVDMSVNSAPTYQRNFIYDRYGCIRQVNDNGAAISSYGYSLIPSHAPVSYNGNTLDYDANGNLIEDGDFIYVYNDANQLSEVRYSANNSLVEKYWYDANGKRIKKQNSDGEFTYYINKFYEIENGTATSYFFRDDERVAKETSEGMEWYLSDHLGSTSLMVDENGLEVERTDYFPYGKIRSGGLEKYGFTGQENNADTGLMYYGARYYSPEYRIFVQPDTLLPDPYHPQTLNRYAYALNNPVKYTDPSGHYVESALDVAFILMDLNDIRQDPSDLWAWAALGADGVCAVVPIATGGGLGVKAIKAGNGIDNAVDTARVIEHSGSLVTRYGDDTGEALAKMSAEIESKGIVGKNPGATGTLKHTEFKRTVDEWSKERGGAEVLVEQSIDASGRLVRGSPSGSLRPDVMEIGDDGIVRIYDLKTGNAKLTHNWMNKVDQRLMSTKEYKKVEFFEVKKGKTTRVR